MNIKIENGNLVFLVPEECLDEHELSVVRHFRQELRDKEFHEARMKALKETIHVNQPIDEKKLEKRAKDGCLEHYSPKCYSDGYIKGATDQRKIDIDKACEWWTNYLDYPTYIEEDRARIREMINDFRKAMEEQL